jgi:multiple sugar transport system permease protein
MSGRSSATCKANRHMRFGKRQRVKDVFLCLLLACGIVLSLYPFLWAVFYSFKPTTEMASPALFPKRPTLANYRLFLGWEGVLPAFWNSIVVSSLTTIVAIVVSLFAAYGIVRFDIRGKRLIFQSIIGAQFIPLSSVIIPFYLLFYKLGLYDTWFSLVGVYLVYCLPFATWLLAGFVQKVPFVLEEAAMVDGCSRIGAIVKVVLPSAMPGIFTTAVFVFIKAWQEYLAALMLTESFRARTLPVVLAGLQTQVTFQEGTIMAGSVLATLPVTIAFLILHKRFLKGATSGAVKG